MIISATPYRISFFGGGTDYSEWFRDNGGDILGTTINHYNYLNCRFLPPFFEEKSRIVWSKIEQVSDHADIIHPVVRAALSYMEVNNGVEIHHMSDLPARSGLGSSSAFCVGVLNALHALGNKKIDAPALAKMAIYLEQAIIGETVGVQDQIHASFGGFNRIQISTSGDFQVTPVDIPKTRKDALQDHVLLFFTGVSRFASDVAKLQVENIQKKQAELKEMQDMVAVALDILNGDGPLEEFGKLLHNSWQLKRTLSSKVAPPFIDDIYSRALEAGAIGGKLLGAGGGGFIIFFTPPERHQNVLNALPNLLHVPIKFETNGSKIIHQSETAYSRTVLGGERNFSKFTAERDEAT